MEPCKYEKELGMLMKATENFEKFMIEMRENHLQHIYEKLENIADKMSHRRPPWSVVWIISALMGVCGILLTALLTGK